jgi:hypothetical protein
VPARRTRRILRLRASIVGIEPEIWRTIDVDDSLSLAQLHMVLQVVFNWFDSHLHRFSEDDPWARNVDPQGRELDRRWFSSLTEPVLDVLEALGLWRSDGRRRDVPPTDAIRVIARLALK